MKKRKNAGTECQMEIWLLVNQSAKFAQESPEPAEAELWTDVYR